MTTCHDTSSWQPSTLEGRDLADLVAPAHFRRIVVGVDGSPNSLAALRFAAQLGSRDGALIEVVNVYRPYLQAQYPYSVAVPPYGPAGEGARDPYAAPGGVVEAAADAQETLEHAVEEVFGHAQIKSLRLRPIEGSSHEVLTKLAADADLLVVGARGHSGAIGLLLGSTAQACARRAPCAVLIVPAP